MKLFSPKEYGRKYVPPQELFATELRAHKRLWQLQGDVVPQVMAVGVLSHTGAFVIATAFSGPTAESLGMLSAKQAGAARDCLHRIHQAGVQHGDIAARNILVDGDRVLFCDFAGSYVDSEEEESSTWRQHDHDELAKVLDKLAGQPGSGT